MSDAALFAALMRAPGDEVPVTLTDFVVRPAWMDRAACRGRDDIDWGDPDPDPLALAICSTCPVRIPCAIHARQNREIGTWGGQSERDRLGRRHSTVLPRRGKRLQLVRPKPCVQFNRVCKVHHQAWPCIGGEPTDG